MVVDEGEEDEEGSANDKEEERRGVEGYDRSCLTLLRREMLRGVIRGTSCLRLLSLKLLGLATLFADKDEEGGIARPVLGCSTGVGALLT